VIEVPNLAWCVTEWLRRQTNDWYLDTIFGNQDDPGQFHLTGYTTKILAAYVKEAGFRPTTSIWMVWNHEQETIHLEACK
jgi:hypothetical protein